jgi:hypothetical protein
MLRILRNALCLIGKTANEKSTNYFSETYEDKIILTDVIKMNL